MDISIRRNEHCIIGLPRCDFVFSSTRTCFIAYGFRTSPMEVSILRTILERNNIQCEEAGGKLAPGQNAFCQKICSKIITSQFCVVLINNDEENGRLIPNANVNMEYGLMLGFNKYVIPFQFEEQKLPFNVAGLDTVKYEKQDFEDKANNVIEAAVKITTQDVVPSQRPDQVVEIFLLLKKLVFTSIEDQDQRNLFRLGAPFGFLLLTDFSGTVYHFFGNFTALRPEIVIWRLKMFNELLNDRRNSFSNRLELGVTTVEQIKLAENLLKNLNITILLTGDEDKKSVLLGIQEIGFEYCLNVYSLSEMDNELMEFEKSLTPVKN